MKQTLTLIILLLGFSPFLQAQKPSEIQEKYEYGKQLFEEQKFGQAKAIFKSISQNPPNDFLIKYSTYFYALSAYQNGEIETASQIANRLVKRFPSWNKIDEVYYLLGLTQFERNLPDSALVSFSKIRNSSFKKNLENVKREKLASYSADQLEFLYQSYPNDNVIEGFLYEKMVNLPSFERNEDLFQKLQEKYESSGEEDSVTPSLFKDVYNIAIFLPFLEESTNPNSLNRDNQFTYDLYEGMLLAKELLAKEDITVQLHPFDTKRDSVHTQQLLEDSKLLDMDLIIGPLYSSTIPLVSTFSKEHEIPMVNPVSSNSAVIQDNPYAYLLMPTVETQGEKVANFVWDNFEENRKAYIIYGNSDTEKKMAETYRDQFLANGGLIEVYEPFDYTKYGFENLKGFLAPLKTNEDSPNATPKPAHVFAAIEDGVAAITLASALANLKINVPTFVPQNWLDIDQLTYDRLEDINAHISYPKYIDYQSDTIQMIKKQYAEKINLLPFDFVYHGVEALYCFGKILNKYGSGFTRFISQEGFQRGIIYSGIDYNGGNDNQFVPIFKFQEGQLIMVNALPQTE